MYNKKEAKLLGRDFTIDLKKVYCEEYLQSVETKTLTKGFKNKIINLCILTPFYFGIFIIIFIIMGLMVSYILPDIAKADDQRYYSIETINTPVPAFLYDNLFIECKEEAINIHHCVKTGLSIAYAESTFGNKQNYFGLMSEDKSIKSWVKKYNKYWYTAKEGGRFYGYDENNPAETRYCVSENSSGSIGFCSNGRKNFNYIFMNKKLDIFIKNNL